VSDFAFDYFKSSNFFRKEKARDSPPEIQTFADGIIDDYFPVECPQNEPQMVTEKADLLSAVEHSPTPETVQPMEVAEVAEIPAEEPSNQNILLSSDDHAMTPQLIVRKPPAVHHPPETFDTYGFWENEVGITKNHFSLLFSQMLIK
jgi:hypothetical protein